MEGIAIPYKEFEVRIKDLEFIDANCTILFLDGDRGEIIVLNPNEILLEELESRGIRYRKLSEDEVVRYSRDLILGLR